jgi:hypothetical protein
VAADRQGEADEARGPDGEHAGAEAASGAAAEGDVNRPERKLPQSYPLQSAGRGVLMVGMAAPLSPSYSR